MKTKHLPPNFVRTSRWLIVSISVSAFISGFLAPPLVAQSQYQWNAISGDWGDAINWAPGGPTGGRTDLEEITLGNGTSGAPAVTTYETSGKNMNRLTLGAHNSLILGRDNSSIHVRGLSGQATSTLENAGRISAQGAGVTFALQAQSATNSGTIETNGPGVSMLFDSQASPSGTVNITNTGGTFQALNGSSFTLKSGNANQGPNYSRIIGGTVRTDETSRLRVSDSNATLRFSDVAVVNAGELEATHATIASGNRLTTIILYDATTLTSEAGALVRINNSGTGTHATAVNRVTALELNNNATFTNKGELLVENTTTVMGAVIGLQSAEFNLLSATASFSNTGTIRVLNATELANTRARFYSVKTLTNEGTVFIQGNGANLGASLVVDGSGNSYLQSGAASATILSRGGELIAGQSVEIAAGSLGGSGQVSGVTTIGAGAVLKPGATLAGSAAGELTFLNHLTLANGSGLEFTLGGATGSSSRVSLAGAANLTLGEDVRLTLHLGKGATLNTTYRLFELDLGTISGSLALNQVVLPQGYTGQFFGGEGASYLDFQLRAIPEPSTWLLFSASFFLCARLARRRRS